MLFNTPLFIFAFLPSVFAVYFILQAYAKNTLFPKLWLVLASLFFYAFWNVKYLPLLVGSIVFNYFIALKIHQTPHAMHKKLWLILGLSANVLLLGFFKYTDFFLTNFNLLFKSYFELLHLILPLAVSFFTLQQIAYLMDTYKHNKTNANNYMRENANASLNPNPPFSSFSHFLDYALFVSFFPQLIAGPIVHHSEMMPQFKDKNNQFLNYRNIAVGLFIFSIGLFKKVVIADNIAHFTDFGFDKAASLSFIQAWMASLSYSFQLYFDFSGYCDMAIGIALFFNIKLPINFNSPYKALNIQDFWRRWHITLSRFLKEYLYIPLGGNRVRESVVYRNLILVFLIGGFWHGAGWTFIIWGLLHGIALSVHRMYSHLAKKFHFVTPKILAWLITFNFVNLAWVFFRAKDLESALKVLKGMVGLNGVVFSRFLEEKSDFLNRVNDDMWGHTMMYASPTFKMCVFIIIISFCLKNSSHLYQSNQMGLTKTISACFLLAIGFLSIFANSQSVFLYFNF
ncbi:MBOAT family peptidoglycan O-acetyltransferase PatA [Helicobacter acinonychis]|uniref:MBOAT family peptidoglycan O-acetyltransferase PatA n=1 Tax=Helicobacter acinonychis TaxID=212 RepID=UPI000CF0FE5B|nr:MBOAT family peptidoglycan O-acetyltransferase PatA [Helicobacter acinonychis]